MADSKALKEAYDEACAVLSSPVRFVEWKMYEARGIKPGQLRPFGLSKAKESAYKEIEGERWIYVFRGFANVLSTAVWVNELHLDAKGQIAATPMDAARVAPDKRPQPVAVGKTITFARRVMGHATAHFFFASRVRLSVGAIDQMQLKVTDYAPPVIFEPFDNDLIRKGDEILVPVLDPVTVALHLHAYYVAAADAVTDYVTTHAGQSDAKQKSVERRLRKVQLARLLKAVIDADKSNQMINRLAPHQGVIDDFLASYADHVAHRVRWRDRWASYLTNWLRAWPMKLVEAEALAQPKEFGRYLVPFCLCINRTNESPEGRKLLGEILADTTHFAHRYLFPKEKVPEAVFGISRKFAGATLEGLKEFGPMIIHLHKTPELIQVAVRSLHGWEFDIKNQVHVLRGGYSERKAWVMTYKTEAKIEPAWEGGLNKIAVFVEIINAALAIHAIIESTKEGNEEKRTMAILEGLGAASDLTAAILELRHASKRTVAIFGFASACIDTYIAVHEGHEGYEKGDTTARAGSYVTAGGAAVTALGWMCVMVGVPGGQVVVIVGLAIQAIGRLISMGKKSDYELYAEHCAWGARYGQDEHRPEYSAKRFEDWKGDYDEQFRALVGLICRFALDKYDNRVAVIRTGFLPSPAWLKVRYVEKWTSASDSADWEDFLEFVDGAPKGVGSSNRLHATKDGDGKFLIRPNHPPTNKSLTMTITVPDDLPSKTRITSKAADLQSIKLSVQLLLKFGKEELRVPRDEMVTVSVDP